MRLGVVSTSYPREPDDPAGNFVAGFTRWLAGQGHEVEVIAAGPGAALVDGVRVHRVDGRGLFYRGGAPDALGSSPGGGLRGLRRSAAAWARAATFQVELLRAVAQRRAGWDAVVTHWLAPSALAVEAALLPAGVLAGPSVRPIARAPGIAGFPGLLDDRRVPHLAIAHSSDVWLLQRSMLGRASIRALSARADLVFAARHLRPDGVPGRVVPMGIDVAALRGDRARGRQRFALDEKTPSPARPCALFLGRLVPVKGLDLLLDALPEQLDLLVAGDGPQRRQWQRAAPPRVRFLGEVRGEAKRDLLAAVDLLVVPSRALGDGRSEGSPVVLLEGLAAGLPIVATRTGGAADLLIDGETGLVVEPNAAALATALRRLADDPALRRTLAQNAAAAAAAHDWSAVGPILAGRLLHPVARRR